MTKYNDGQNGITVFSATEFNNTRRGLRNAITDSDQTIQDGNHFQISQAMANNAAVANFYTDSGAADAYVLTAIGNFKGLSKLIKGAKVRFRADNNSTGATATINVNGLGAKDIKKPDGVTGIAVNDISTLSDTILRYDLANDVWILAIVGKPATTTAIGNVFLKKQVTTANNSVDLDHDIDFLAGTIDFADGTGQAVFSALTKQGDATFALGNNVGGMASGESLSANSTYHFFVLSSVDGSVTDAGFDTDVNAANLLADGVVSGAGLTKFRRVQSMITDTLSNFVAYVQTGNYTDIEAIESFAGTVTTTVQTIPLDVPIDIITRAIINVFTIFTASPGGTTIKHIRVYAVVFPDVAVVRENSQLAAVRNANTFESAGQSSFDILTNALGQVKIRSNNSTSNDTEVGTRGWIDLNL